MAFDVMLSSPLVLPLRSILDGTPPGFSFSSVLWLPLPVTGEDANNRSFSDSRPVMLPSSRPTSSETSVFSSISGVLSSALGEKLLLMAEDKDESQPLPELALLRTVFRVMTVVGLVFPVRAGIDKDQEEEKSVTYTPSYI